MIGLIVPSDAPVFVGGQAVHGVAASPFVLGQSASYHHGALRADIVHSSSCRNHEHSRLGPCHQCFIARFHHLIGELGPVHWLPNPIRIGSFEPSPKNLQESNKARSSSLGATLLLALQLPRLLKFRGGTTRWYTGHSLLLVRLLTSSNSLHPSGQRLDDVQRNYLEYVAIWLHHDSYG